MKSPRLRLAPLFRVVLLVCVIQSCWASPQHPEGKPQEAAPLLIVWLDADGVPLPFQTDEAIIEFLHDSAFVSWKRVGIGINAIRKVLLERDGVRAHAAFREVRVRKRHVRLQDGNFHMIFVDDCRFEVAAYRLSSILGINKVPPAIERTIRNRKGTLQIWVENARMHSEFGEDTLKIPPEANLAQQFQVLGLFDSLVSNDDRNAGNLLWDADWNLWLIDHTRAFRQNADAKGLERLRLVKRSVFKKLKEVEDATIEAELKGLLSRLELMTLLKRRQQIVQHLERLIAERGENSVLYDK